MLEYFYTNKKNFPKDFAILVEMEVHDEPEKALCDGPNSITLSQLEDILKYLIDLDFWVKSRSLPEVS